jgi:TonB family protein
MRRGAGSARLRPGLIFSALLHLGFAALVVLASLRRERPPEPLPPPSYEVEFEGGAQERPAERESNPLPTEPEAPPPPSPPPEPPVEAVQPPAPETAPTLAEEPPPPLPPLPEEAQTAEVEPAVDDLPVPPPPAPPPPVPQREAAVIAPPRPARPPPPSEPLPGLFLPEARNLQPAPRRQPGSRLDLDISPPRLPQAGRDSIEPRAIVRGAKVGPDWFSALRRWMDDHGRYPTNAALVGHEGTTRILLTVDPDGRVRSGKLVRQSGSIWLDAGTVSLFRNAMLPPFPPGADPAGVTIDFTINYVLIR